MEVGQSSTKKTFWQKPENITGLILPAILIFLGIYFSAAIAPMMLLALQGGLYSLAFAAVVGLLAFLVINKEWRIALLAFYTVWMKRLTSLAIEMDPIAIIRKHLTNLMHQIEEMSGSIDVVAGENKKLQNKIQKNNSTMENLKQTAIIAKNKMTSVQPNTAQWLEYKSKADLDARQHGRLQKSNTKLNEMLARGQNLESILERQYAAAKYVYADMKAEVDLQEDEWKITSASFNAYECARKVLAGDEDDQAMYVMSMEYMADEMGRKVGEIERFNKNSTSILTGMDIENEAFAMKGMKMIDEWSSAGDQMFVTSPKEGLKLDQSVNLSGNIGSQYKPDVVLSKSKYR